MRHPPPIRPALLGMSGTTAALVIGLTLSGVPAAHGANAQQLRPIATAFDGTGSRPALLRSSPPWPLQLCWNTPPPTLAFDVGVISAPVNILNGPFFLCHEVGMAEPGDSVYYHCSERGWAYVGVTGAATGWIPNLDLPGRVKPYACPTPPSPAPTPPPIIP
jgi:hypothetical protein